MAVSDTGSPNAPNAFAGVSVTAALAGSTSTGNAQPVPLPTKLPVLGNILGAVNKLTSLISRNIRSRNHAP